MADEATPAADLLGKLLEVQRELKVEKGQWNSFGKYKYRSKEDILEAAKPLCHERGLLLLCEDALSVVGSWVYVVTKATVTDVATGASFSAAGLAREPESKKGADASQVTGMTASYAGKRALGNLFALDDTADSDASQQVAQANPRNNEPPAQGPFNARCRSCGTAYQFPDAASYRAFVAQAQCCDRPDWVVDA